MNSFSVPLSVLDNEITVDVFESSLFKLEQDKLSQKIIDKLPGVYCFFDNESIYIGESVHPFRRLKQHLQAKKITAKDQVIIFRSEQFHKSSIYDIETRLIEYVGAEQKIQLRNIKDSQGHHDYFLKYAYSPVIKKIWEILQEYKLSSKSALEIENSQIYKLSPFKDLNSDQEEALDVVKNKNADITIIKGYPGTGKSILASKLYQSFSQNMNICLTSGTHHTVSAFKEVFKLHQKAISTESKILKTSALLKDDDVIYDMIIVDEAHRLSKKSGKGHPMKYAHIDSGKNELDMIMQKAKKVIILYDDNQVVHDGDFILGDKIIESAEIVDLKVQMRSHDGDEYINWTMNWLKNNFLDYQSGSKYELKLFDNFSEMYEQLKNKSKKYDLTRLVSGYTREWVSKNEPHEYDFNIDGISLRWNNMQAVNNGKWMNSEAAKNLEEVSYYHVVQGFDMHYAGVIIGKDLYLDENDEIQINEEYVVHTNQKPKKSDVNYHEKLKTWVLNRYKILLSRGSKGTYIYIEDDKLRSKIKQLLM